MTTTNNRTDSESSSPIVEETSRQAMPVTDTIAAAEMEEPDFEIPVKTDNDSNTDLYNHASGLRVLRMNGSTDDQEMKEAESKDDADTSIGFGSTDDLEDVDSLPEKLPWWYPRSCFGIPAFYGNKEALGWACSAVAQASVLIGTGAFILPAIQRLAKEEAGCITEAPEGEDLPDCEGRVYGIKPSSLLTFMVTVVGMISAFIIPPIGAVVDYTSHRRLIGKWLSVFYSLLILALAFLGEDSWFGLSFCFLASVSIGLAQSMLFNAYLPELTSDESRLNEFSKTFTVLIFTTMVVYLIVVMGVGMAAGVADDDVALARIAAIAAFVLSAVLFYVSWWLCFEDRPAARALPEGQTLCGAGFRQVHRTSIRIWNDYRALKWFYISICFGDAAIQSLSIIAITFVTDFLQFSSQEVGVAALLLLLGSIPGALFGALTNSKINPIKSSELAVFGMMIGTAFAAFTLKEPGQQVLTYFFAFLWGFGTGWKYTADRVLAAGLIPEGQDAELMGFYMFCGQIFAWAPSLLFTILNEAGVSQRIGLATLIVVFLGALVSYGMMGDYATAIGVADRFRPDTIASSAAAQPQADPLQRQQREAEELGDFVTALSPEDRLRLDTILSAELEQRQQQQQATGITPPKEISMRSLVHQEGTVVPPEEGVPSEEEVAANHESISAISV